VLVALTVIGAVCVVAAAIIAYGEFRWNSGTTELRGRLEAARLPTEPKVFDRRELEGLPAPVQRYFRAALRDGQPIVAAVNAEHTGTFNRSEAAAQWKPFTSTQRVITRRPGFDWDARIAMMPGVPVRVHDAYIAGQGTLHAAVFGLVSVVNVRDTPELARGELMRFLAEAAWYPTSLLPSQGVHWDAVDDHSARATLTDGDISVTLLFRFAEDDLIDTVRADARGRMVGATAVPTPWGGRLWSYAIRDGMRVPLEGEVAWLLPEGAKPYWRGQITTLIYEFSE
jgi:hypothetical protein